MLNLNKFTYTLLYLMLLSPILSYITLGVLGLSSITLYFQAVISLYGLIFILFKWKEILFKKTHYFILSYSIYIFIWSFFNGLYIKNGFFTKPNLIYPSIFFILVIIDNSSFSLRFIQNSIYIIKITVVLAFIASIIQVFNFNFLNATKIWDNSEQNIIMGNRYLVRRSSIFGYLNPIEIGLSFMPLLSVLIGFLLYHHKKVMYIFLFLGCISALLSNFRFVIIAFVIIIIQVLLYHRKQLKAMFLSIALILFMILMISYTFNYLDYNINDWFNKRLFAEGTITKTTRYKGYENFLIFFPRNVIFGTGVHLTKEIEQASRKVGSSQIHVGYLSHLVSYGLVGSFILFGFWFSLLKELYRTATHTNFWGSYFAFLIFLWAQATLVYYSIFFYGIIFALIFNRYYLVKYIHKYQMERNSRQINDTSKYINI